MPLTRIQRKALKAIAANRNPDSYIAGGTAINDKDISNRISYDIDIFNSVESSDDEFTSAILSDISSLEQVGFKVIKKSVHAFGANTQITISDGQEELKLDWVKDSSYRFFPVIEDPEYGYRLHIADLATNKALACAGRSEARDLIDLIFLHHHWLPLGPIVWAAVDKDLGFNPVSLLSQIKRSAVYQQEDFNRLKLVEPVDARAILTEFKVIVKQAEIFVASMPAQTVGAFFMKENKIVSPNPQKLDQYTLHRGSNKGAWPSSSLIMSEMIQDDISP